MLTVDKLNELNKCENGGKCESCNFSIDGICHIDIIEDVLKYRQALEIVYNSISNKFKNNEEAEEVSVTFNKQFRDRLAKLLEIELEKETPKPEIKNVAKTKINDYYYMEDIEKIIIFPVGFTKIKQQQYNNPELKGFERLKMVPVNNYIINGHKRILDKDVKFELSTDCDFDYSQMKIIFKDGIEKLIDIYSKFKILISPSDNSSDDYYEVVKAIDKNEAIEILKKRYNDLNENNLVIEKTYDDLTILTD